MFTEEEVKVVAEQAGLASLVTYGDLKLGECRAWIESADRACGKKVDYHLCKRHFDVAVRRSLKLKEKRRAQQAKWAAEREAERPALVAELERLNAIILREDPPRPSDRAAYTGFVHPSITKRRLAGLSDAKVQRMARLYARKAEIEMRLK